MLRSQRENSPVFYLEPDDWSEDVVPKTMTSPTRALSPCGCGKTHKDHTHHMESLPEEACAGHCVAASKKARKSASVISGSMPIQQKSASGNSASVLALPCCSPRAAMMSELAQQQNTRQRKVTIPILQHSRAVSSSLIRRIFKIKLQSFANTLRN